MAMNLERELAQLDFQKADAAWQAELESVFKTKAGDARYNSDGRSTPRLKLLHARRMEAFHVWDDLR